MIEGVLGNPLLLELVLTDRESGLFPRAKIIDPSGAQVAPVMDMTESPAWPGLYQAEWPNPSSAGHFSIVFEVWQDAGHTVAADYEAAVQHVLIVDPQAAVDNILDGSLAGHTIPGSVGEALKIAFADGGGAVRDDALSYDGNDRPVVLRRRIFPDAATAAASTPGGTGEGEIITISVNAQHTTPERWLSLLRRRTA